jgi:hypothetical protein
MSRYHVAKRSEPLNNTLKSKKTFATGIRFIAAHYGCPLLGGHSAGAGIGEQVEQHIDSAKLEQVVSSALEQKFTLLGCSASEWLNAFDPERFNDGLHFGNSSLKLAAQAKRSPWSSVGRAKIYLSREPLSGSRKSVRPTDRGHWSSVGRGENLFEPETPERLTQKCSPYRSCSTNHQSLLTNHVLLRLKLSFNVFAILPRRFDSSFSGFLTG